MLPPVPPAPPDESAVDYSSYVAVLDTTDNFSLAAATGLLNEAEIPYVIDDEPRNVSREVLTAEHKWWTPPCRIWAAPEREKEAREILDNFAHPQALEIDPEEDRS